MKIEVKGLALTLGILFGLTAFVLGVLSLLFGFATDYVVAMAALYIGFAPTLIGSIMGAIWGFVHCAISGAVIALVYNKLTE